MVVQGCVLANTAIEKYLKALYAHLEQSIPHSHAVQTLYTGLKASGKSTVTLNESFLNLLQKAYALRYPDDLPDDFNIALNQMKILAELDRSVFAITNSFKFNEGMTDFALVRAAQAGDQRYLARNVLLNPEHTSTFFSTDSQSFEFRTRKPLIVNVDYLSPRVADDGLFDQEGVVLTPSQGINLAFPRGDGETIHKEMFDWPK